MEKASLNLPEMQLYAAECAKEINGGEVIALIGELGAGKTTFVKSLLKARGLKKRVTSPTFGIMVPYASRGLTFYHVDLYRIKDFTEFKTLGIPENWTKPKSVHLIEWADKIQKHLPKGAIIMRFSVEKDGRHSVKVSKK
jgi:tRNA threonylcarbamoyladenosine biosynthesis protein TsaE